MKRTLKHMLASVALTAIAGTAQANCSTPDSAYIGSVCSTAGVYCPVNTLPADGRKLPLYEYQMLYSVIGPVYGGDGITEFRLPNLNIGLAQGKQMIPPQMLRCIVVDGQYPARP